jgi:hypothetical protein
MHHFDGSPLTNACKPKPVPYASLSLLGKVLAEEAEPATCPTCQNTGRVRIPDDDPVAPHGMIEAACPDPFHASGLGDAAGSESPISPEAMEGAEAIQVFQLEHIARGSFKRNLETTEFAAIIQSAISASTAKLQAENARLREALAPFAVQVHADAHDTALIELDSMWTSKRYITVQDIRRAAQALKEQP